jgi:hypothetical protein
MEKNDEAKMKLKIERMLPLLNEYQRRMFLSSEAKSIGRGGISLVSRLSGVSRPTITEGIKELESCANSKVLDVGRSRLSGGGRKSVWELQPKILDELKDLVDAHTKGDPMRLLLYTNKSQRVLSNALKEKGYNASKNTVRKMLKMLGYGLQADKKTLTVKASPPDRNEQFEHINNEAKKALTEGNPIISIDAKKKEKIGNFKNNGQTYQPHKTPIEVLDHDFPIKELGKATPFGIYNIFENKGFVNVGLSSDTAAFAVESVRRWWYAEGILDYPNAQKIVITADCGGSNGNKNRLWKFELQKLANEIGKDIQVLHYPPGTSKWNKIEHRMFAFISKNWQGIPLVSVALILSLIGATKTDKGLSIHSVLDESVYKTGTKVSDRDFDSIFINESSFHGEWNYTICRIL